MPKLKDRVVQKNQAAIEEAALRLFIRQGYFGTSIRDIASAAGIRPRGAPLTQARVKALSEGPGALLFCGRFEGLDQRAIDARDMEEISVGDFVLAVGSRLIYTDTYDEALAQLSSEAQQLVQQATAPGVAAPSAPAVAPGVAPSANARLSRVREHLQRYRELTSQGKLAEAGKELEAIEAEVK